VLYESFLHPLTILSGLPSAGVGALLTLLLFRMELNLYGFVGIIMLIGIVKKNAIMMIDFAQQAEARGKSSAEAIYEGCLLRFRPIMMTTLAALVGTLPIAIGFGAGADSRRPLGLAVVGGLILSQLLTLYITPVTYIYLDSFGAWLRRHWRARQDPASGVAQADGAPVGGQGCGRARLSVRVALDHAAPRVSTTRNFSSRCVLSRARLNDCAAKDAEDPTRSSWPAGPQRTAAFGMAGTCRWCGAAGHASASRLL
jgi:hypothetical protein